MKLLNSHNIIFLDLDGVMNSEIYFTHVSQDLDTDDMINHIDERAIDVLNKIKTLTDSKIVISSSWKHTCFDEDYLQQRGFHGKVIGVTPSLHNYCRGQEIKKWIQDNMEYPEKYSNYVIIDDDDDMLYEQRFHFFKTDGYVGLTHTMGMEIINFLNYKVRR